MMDEIEKMKAFGKGLEDMFLNCCKIKMQEPVGYLIHNPTRTQISVYKPISWFKAFMLEWCFDLKYEKI